MEHACHREQDAIALGLLLPAQCGLRALQSTRAEGLSRESTVVGVTMRAHARTSATFAINDELAEPVRTEEIVAAMARFRLRGASPICVMVIDDDWSALHLMRATLKSIGIDVGCVPDGRTALRELDRHRPDTIIVDLVMPQFQAASQACIARSPAARTSPDRNDAATALRMVCASCATLRPDSA